MYGEHFRGARVAVTGGAGFAGSHLVDALIEAGADVSVLDDLSTGFREFVNPRARFHEVDLLDARALPPLLADRNVVFHFAANADVRFGLRHPRRDTEQNLIATQNVLEAMREGSARRIAFASSGAVYGDATLLPTPEDAPFPVQTSLYGASKAAAEGLLGAYAHGFGFTTYVFRFVSLLGPRYTHGHVFDFWRKLRADPAHLEVLGDGSQRKSYLHVADAVEAVLQIVTRAGPGHHVYNIGHEEWLPVRESVRLVCEALGLSPRIVYGGGERGWAGDAPRVLLDTRKLRALGWKPQRSLPESIRDTLAYLEQNPFCARRPEPS